MKPNDEARENWRELERQALLVHTLGQVTCGATTHSEWLAKVSCPFCKAVK